MDTLRRIPALLAPLLLACNAQPPARSAEAVTADLPAPSTSAGAPAASHSELLARGEYLVRIGTCNDCHTPGYNEVAGDLPTAQWLVGSPVGFHGPWGTTFAANLRLKTADMDDAAWLQYTGQLHTRPIMPDFMLRAMKQEDRLAIFRFIKSLGPAGQPAPDYLPPGQKPQAPYWELVLPAEPAPQAPAAG